MAPFYVSTFEDNVEYWKTPEVYYQRDLDSPHKLLANVRERLLNLSDSHFLISNEDIRMHTRYGVCKGQMRKMHVKCLEY